MTKSLSFRVEPFAALAEVYVQAGFADYGLDSVATYVNYAQSLNWAGRRVLDVGCGPALTTWWLTENGYRAAGIESSPYLLALAQQIIEAKVAEAEANNIMHAPPELVRGSLTQIESPIGAVDLVIAVNGVVNNVLNLQELGQMFAGVWRALEPGKLFMFDVHTLRGLSANAGQPDRVIYDNGTDLTVIARCAFSFETLTNVQNLMIFRRAGECWRRQDEQHVQKGYPVMGIAALLERSNFVVDSILNPDMSPFDAAVDPYGRAVFVARKRA